MNSLSIPSGFFARITLTFGLLLPGLLYGTVIRVANLSADSVQAAIDSALAGDIIVLPPGTSTWTTTVNIAKAITIQGAGVGQTVITNTMTSVNGTDHSTFAVTIPLAAAEPAVQISAIEFQGSRTATGILVNGTDWRMFRIDHCKFVEMGNRGIYVRANAGLVDHCVFVDCLKTVDVYSDDENKSWNTPLTLGTTNSVVIEDCDFVYQSWYPESSAATASVGQGGRRTIRHCRWNNALNISFYPIFDSHGNQAPVTGQGTVDNSTTALGGTGTHRGTRQSEIYENTITGATFAGKSYRLTDIRGGTNILFSNTFTGGGMATSFYMREEDNPASKTGVSLTGSTGYDPIVVHAWDNYSNGTLISRAEFAYATDPLYIVDGVNLFWTQPSSYSPLKFPHPFRDMPQARPVVEVTVQLN